MKCAYACDIDEHARTAYQHNFCIEPDGDITQVHIDGVPVHDILCAGFPCQPFSIIGDQKGFNDLRGTLFFDILRIARGKMPQAIILENVKQLVTHDKGNTMSTILSSLEKIGYWVTYKVLNALDFGLPQKRERVIIVGILGGQFNFKYPKNTLPMKSLTAILEKKVDKRHYVSDRIRMKRHAAHTSKYLPSIWHENKGGNISSYPYSCALRAGASHNYLLVNGERRLTSRELLRLQGFPDTYKIVCTESQTRKQAGNSVPVPMVAAVIGELKHAVEERQRQIQCATVKRQNTIA